MTPDLLTRIGEALYGPRWQSALALALSVDRSTIVRWARGDYPIPGHALGELRWLVNMRRDDLGELVGELDAIRQLAQ